MQATKNTTSLKKALQLLSCITKAKQPLGFSELVTQTKIPKATVHRILANLQQESLIRFDRISECYHAGYGLLELAQSTWENIEVRQLATDQLEQLSNLTGETIHLAVLDGGDIIYIDKIESNKNLRLYSSIGKKASAYCTGVGKAILAHLKATEQHAAIEQQSFQNFTKNTITNSKALVADLTQIKQQGYAIDNEEHEQGIYCIAAPIFDRNGIILAAISVTFPLFRTEKAQLKAYQPAIKQAASQISKRLGYVIKA